MKRLIAYSLLLTAFFVSGCVMRTYTYELDRVDQELEGNRGFIMGTPSSVSKEPQREKTRTIYNIEVELPSAYKTRIEQEDKDLYGNRGYIMGEISPEKEIYIPQERQGGITTLGGFPQQTVPRVIYSEPVKKETMGAAIESEFYVVEKGDTLQKISNKFFGTTKKWKRIYEANKDVLKSPDRIRPGQKLIIPKD